MKKNNVINILLFIFLNNFIFLDLHSKIVNNIIAKVGNSLITSVDLQNEIITNLVLDKKNLSQENINSTKNYSVQNLTKRVIKKDEINKYQIKSFNKKDLQNYIETVAKSFNTDQNGLKEIFKQNNISFSKFIERYKIELLWNTLIFKIYKDQINLNIVEINNEIKKIKENKNDAELKKITEEITNKKKEDQLNLFSRSHYSSLENSIYIDFQ